MSDKKPETPAVKTKPRPTTPHLLERSEARNSTLLERSEARNSTLYNRGKKPKPGAAKPETRETTTETPATKPKSANALARDKNNAKKGQRNQNRVKPENSKTRARAGVPQERYFFGVFVPKELQSALETMQKKLVGKWWKATPADQFHVTLLYLGGANKKTLETASLGASAISKSLTPFAAKLRGTGFFPNEGGPRVWFIKAESEIFTTLHEALRDKLEVVPDEKFKSHVTLARKKGASPRPAPIVLDLEWQITEFALVRSVLSKEGPNYSILERFTLGDNT